MSTALLTRIGSDAWNAELYDSLSFTSHIAAAIRSRAAALSMAIQLRRLVSKLDNILDKTHSMIEGKVPIPKSDEDTTPQRVHNTIDTIQMISRVLASTYESAKRKRLTNNSLLAGPLSRVNQLSEEFADLGDWIEVAALQTGEIDKVFDRATHEREHGDIYDLSQVD